MKFKKKKIRIGIDINEILRARWIQFDKYYMDEFGGEGLPDRDNPYVYDLFNEYEWKNTVEYFRELREPEDTPEFINPLDYVIDEKTGEAPADAALFKKEEKIALKPKEVYNRFMFEDYLLEIHGLAPMIYRGVDLDLNKFYETYKDKVEFIIYSVENRLSISPTLFFLSKMLPRIQKYLFIENEKEIWDSVDVVITTNPYFFKNKTPKDKKVIKVKRPYNVSEEHKHYDIETTELINLITCDKFKKII